MRYIFYFFIFLFLSVYLVPLYGSIDYSGPQWLYLNVLNILFLLFLYRLPNFIFLNIFNFLPLRFFLLFVLLAAFSLTYTVNLSLSLQDLSRHITILISILLISSSFVYFKPNFFIFSFFVVFTLLIESIYSLSPLILDVLYNGFGFLEADAFNLDAFKGVSGNRNITTASLVVKVPFLFFLFSHYKNYFIKAFFGFILLFPLFSMFFIGSRAALLSLSLIVFFSFIYLFISTSFLRSLFSYIFLCFFIILAYYSSSFLTPVSSSTSIERLQSVSFTNESSSNRFILWENALDYISNHPFLGSGIGTWKVESALYWGSIGSDYLVPFHAHNDFLEFSTELGILGGLFYFLIFLFSFLFIFKHLGKLGPPIFTLFLSLGAYFIDSCLNFPFERPLMQVPFILLLSFIFYFHFYTKRRHE